jgi:adenosine deaminase
MELRFAGGLSRAERFPLNEVMDWVIAARSAPSSITVRLISVMNRHESRELAEEVAWLAAERKDQSLVGLDLAGNEAEFGAEPFQGVFSEASQEGLHVCIHAGEWGPAANVREAIERLGAERISHGIRVLEDRSITELARERETPFEVCVTSNYQSGVVPEPGSHPLPRMLAAGLNVTIGTDDPSVSRITLSGEYQVVCEELGLSMETLRQRILAPASSFPARGGKGALEVCEKSCWKPSSRCSSQPAPLTGGAQGCCESQYNCSRHHTPLGAGLEDILALLCVLRACGVSGVVAQGAAGDLTQHRRHDE